MIETWALTVTEPGRRTFRAILDRPEVLKVAWHRQVKRVCDLLDEHGHGRYGTPPQASLWDVRTYRRVTRTDYAATYELTHINGQEVTR